MGYYRKVGIATIGDELQTSLSAYTADIQMGVSRLVDIKSEKLKNEIQANAPVRTKKIKGRRKGKYKKSFRVKETHHSYSYHEKTVFSSGKEYRLTHLLEKPHKSKNGGTVQPKEHIAPAAERIKKEFIQEVEELIKSSKNNGGGEKRRIINE